MSENLRVARNALALYVAEAGTRALQLVLFVVVARALPPEQYGALTYAVTLAFLAGIASDFGASTLVAKLVAQDPAGAGRIVGSALAARLALGVAAYGAALTWLILARPGPAVAYLAITSAAALATPHVAPIASALRSLDWTRSEAVIRTASLAAGTCVALAAVKLGGGLVGLALGQALGTAALGVASAVAGRRAGALLAGVAPAGGPREVLGFLRLALPFGIPVLVTLLYSRQGVIVLEAVSGQAELGLYGAAYRLVEATYMVPSVFSLSLMPGVAAALSRGDREAAGRVATNVMSLLFAVALPAAATLSCGADVVIGFLLRRTAYSGAADVLAICTWTIPAVYGGMISGTLVNASARPGVTAWIALAMTAVSAACLVALTPGYGARGAALAAVATEWTGFVLSTALAVRLAAPMDLRAVLGPPLLAAAAAAPALFALGAPRGLAVALPVYGAALLLLDREGRVRRALSLGLRAARGGSPG